MMLAFLQVATLFMVATPWLLVIAGIAALVANGLMVMSLSDDLLGASEYAFARFATLFLTTVLFIILEQYIIFTFPILFAVSVVFALVAMIHAIVSVIFQAKYSSYREPNYA